MSCAICIEDYNKATRKVIVCDFCNFEACRECCAHYVLSTALLPHCMKCRVEWNRKILVEKFPKTFLKDLKEHREQILFEQEKAMLPEAQIYVEEAIRREKIAEEIKSKYEQIRKIRDEQIRKIRDELSVLKDALKGGVVEVKRQFMRSCPQNNCRGFLSSQWKCGLCEVFVCPHCHEVKGTTRDVEHTCKPENVETARLLAKDTKPCPKCAALIFKIQGCDQMWCTQCHTPFSWRTGKFESGGIHNPEYFKWMRENRALEQKEDMQCRGDIRDLVLPNTRDSVILNAFRSIGHIQRVVLPDFRVNDNRDLRIRYLRGYIKDEEFKIQLQKRDKANGKNNEITGVFNMYIACSTDVLYKFVRHPQAIEDTRRELQTLRTITNDCLLDISKVYNSKRYKLDNKFNFEWRVGK